MSHRREDLPHDDLARSGGHTFGEAVRDRGDHLVEAQSVFEMLFGGVADLGVHNAIRSQVLHTLAGDARDPGGRLHDAHGVRERLEVALQRA